MFTVFRAPKTFAVGAPPWTPLGSLQCPLDLVVGGEGTRWPFPKSAPPLSAFGFDFRPFRPQFAFTNSNCWL